MIINFCGCHTAVFSATDVGGGGWSKASNAPAHPSLVEDIAIASRICAAENVFDAFGHLSVRSPDSPDRFFMTKSMAPALATSNDIVELDLDGNASIDEKRPLFLERFIHGEIYRMRPDVHSIVHSHSLSVVPFSVVKTPMRAMFHTAAFIAEGVPNFDIAEEFGETNMLINDRAKGNALARTLGDKPVCLMRGHGSVAVGASLQHAVSRAVYTELNARLQVQAMQLGGSIVALTTGEGIMADAVNVAGVGRPWELWKKRALREMALEQQA
jgi:HCOMODA/2-hydroxy-3-carboxy-muconic semialdehyde decarboxylase